MRSFKGLCTGAAAAACVAAVLLLLDFLLYPCTFVRSDIHQITTRTFDDVFLGTSHGKMNINPEAMREVSGRTGHNACVGGEYPVDVYYLARLMCEKGHKPQRIVYVVSPGYLSREKEEGNNYLLFYHEYPPSLAKLAYFRDCLLGKNLRTWFFPWYEYPLSYELPRMASTAVTKWTGDYGAEQFRTDSQVYHDSGFVGRFAVDTSQLTTDGLSAPDVHALREDNLDWIRKLALFCREQGIELVTVSTPVPLPNLQAFPAEYQEMWEAFDAFFGELGVPWLNFNDAEHFGLFTHEIMAFTDMDGHMNEDAANAFSRVLAAELA